MSGFFDTGIEYLKGVGPQKADLLKKELKIFTFSDLIHYYPFRHEDRTKFYKIGEIHEDLPSIQVVGELKRLTPFGYGRKKRLTARLVDDSGEIELVWFKGVQWIAKKLKPGLTYIVFGNPTLYGKKLNIAHPEIELYNPQNLPTGYLQPIYPSTENLKRKYLDSKAISKLTKTLIDQAFPRIKETFSDGILNEFKLISKAEALINIHYPESPEVLKKAQFRLKFEELFFIQLRLLKLKINRINKFKGQVFNSAQLVTEFYKKHIPFELTDAQKRVVKEAYKDMRSGHQMNRLLQGDVGSGKTIVAFLCMLLAVNGKAQSAMMAPTEILAIQHYNGLKIFAQKIGLRIAILTGSSKTKDRNIIHQYLRSGDLDIIVGTHALLEEIVQFKNLGLAVIDEQHRFGVAQRSKLWRKNRNQYPHIMVMTATPIPRTLAMALYGDLDISVIDELPAGRKPIKTIHRYDSNRLKVWGFVKEQIAKGSQVYIVYPLIEESEKMDLKDLMDGYESVCRSFPDIPVSILHGKMKSEAKDFEMQRFVKGETKIMVATTVIEVGVDVTNASVMIIENAERFGLAQLHQLRGRVGRGADQSFCVLMTKYELTREARMRIEIMVKTNNGFEIADTDLQLRGPGDLMGTQQSGILDLLIADLAKDGKILQIARQAAQQLISDDPNLEKKENQRIKTHIDSLKKTVVNWSRVS